MTRIVQMLWLLIWIVLKDLWLDQRALSTAVDPTTHPETLRQLAARRGAIVKRAVAANPNTPTDVLLELGAEFPQALLNNPVFHLLLLEHPNLLEAMPSETLTNLLQQPNLPIPLLEQAAAWSELSLESAIAIAQNPTASPQAIAAIQRYAYDASVAQVIQQGNDPWQIKQRIPS